MLAVKAHSISCSSMGTYSRREVGMGERGESRIYNMHVIIKPAYPMP